MKKLKTCSLGLLDAELHLELEMVPAHVILKASNDLVASPGHGAAWNLALFKVLHDRCDRRWI